jgi:hypothetical protein
MMRFKITAANSAEGFGFVLRVMQYANPLEDFLAHDDI